jgi:hypothetical protein
VLGSWAPPPADPDALALTEGDADGAVDVDGSADPLADGLGLADAPEAVMVSAIRLPYPTAAL